MNLKWEHTHTEEWQKLLKAQHFPFCRWLLGLDHTILNFNYLAWLIICFTCVKTNLFCSVIQVIKLLFLDTKRISWNNSTSFVYVHTNLYFFFKYCRLSYFYDQYKERPYSVVGEFDYERNVNNDSEIWHKSDLFYFNK